MLCSYRDLDKSAPSFLCSDVRPRMHREGHHGMETGLLSLSLSHVLLAQAWQGALESLEPW